jgi:hypothetical protein
VTDFYQVMIKELLQRHDFRLDRTLVTRRNQFSRDDKYRFLRELALAMANRPGEFADFSYRELADFAEVTTRPFAKVKPSDLPTFLDEIIDHSGLLAKAKGAPDRAPTVDVYQFAHLSVQEYLAAEELARQPTEAVPFLLDRAGGSEWRGVISFYVTRGPAKIEEFLRDLAKSNLELAGHCLGSATWIDDPPAEAVLDALTRRIKAGDDVSTHLAALASVAASPRESIRQAATDSLVSLL